MPVSTPTHMGESKRFLLSSSLLIAAFAASGLAQAQAQAQIQSQAQAQFPDYDDSDSALELSATALSKTREVHLRLGTGLGVFQDLQVPVDNEVGLRIDGTAPSPDENTTHSGFPIFAGLTFVWPRSAMNYGIGFEALQVEAGSGNPMTRTSSYARLEIKPTATWSFSAFDQGMYLGTSVAMRRSLYKNVSDGHFADSAMIRLTAGMEAPGEARIEAFGGYAPLSRFSYDTGKGIQNSSMKGTTTAAYEFGANLNYHIWNTTWLDFSAEQEVVTVEVQNTNAYNDFGLYVARNQEASKRYHLQTTLLKIALRRAF